MNRIILFGKMLVAANSAALAIYLCVVLIGAQNYVDYWYCLAVFLAFRVCAFMANRQMELNDENVNFMSVERIKWNVATMAVLAVMICLKSLII